MKTLLYWLPLHVGDYLKDTVHLSAIEHGVYLLLIMAYWNRQGPLPDDHEYLRKVTKLSKEEWQTHSSVMAEFFQVGDGLWRHKRVDAELSAAKGKQQAKSAAGMAGAAAKHGKRVADAQQTHDSVEANGKPSQTHTDRRSMSESSAERPSLDEVLDYAMTIGLHPWKAKDWFNEMQGCGWIDFNHRPIQEWRPVLVRVKTKWEADGRPSGPPASRHTATQGSSPGMGGADKIIHSKELERVEARMAAIRQQYSGHQTWSTEDRFEIRKLRERKETLKKMLGVTV